MPLVVLAAVFAAPAFVAPASAAPAFAAGPAVAACPPAGFATAAVTPSPPVAPTTWASACAAAIPFGRPPGISLQPAQFSPVPGRYNAASSGGGGSPLPFAIVGGFVLAAALGTVGLVLWLAGPARRSSR